MDQELFTKSTPVAIALSLTLVGTLAWRVKPAGFRSLSWQAMTVASALFWGMLAAILVSATWGFYYRFFVPAWYRLAAPLGAIVLYPFIGLFLKWAALRLPGNPVVWFTLLGGLESVLEHAVGIYGFGVLDVPMLRGTSALAIFIFAYFEYVVYWSIVLALAAGVDHLRRVRRNDAEHSHEDFRS